MEEYELQTELGKITVYVIRSNRKSLAMHVRNGKFTLRAPLFVSDRYIRNFLQKNIGWIEERQRSLEQEKQENADLLKLPERQLTRKELQYIKDVLEERTRYYAEQMGVSFGRIAVRNQQTRWGSCSSAGNLNFNYKLFFMPARLRDYVIIHELAHRVHMNHSKEFWGLVESYCPDYRERVEELKKIH